MLIKLNYEMALSQARQLNNAASGCKEKVAYVQKQIEQIQQNWTGEAAEAMIEKLRTWIKETSQTAETLDKLAVRVKKKADYLKAVDEQGGSFGGGNAGGGGGAW